MLMVWTAYFLCLGYLATNVAVAEAKKLTTYPQRTNDDSALLEWGHSAVIHAADAVVAQFGLKTVDQEFDLGIEAAPIFARPSQGCEPLRNAHDVTSQVRVVDYFSSVPRWRFFHKLLYPSVD
jgi:hypothetical protein